MAATLIFGTKALNNSIMPGSNMTILIPAASEQSFFFADMKAFTAEWVFALDELDDLAASLAVLLPANGVVALHGTMGAGKTTLIAALCRHWGVADAVGSPTFSIINEYRAADGRTILHMDWYRLRDEEEALQAGVEDALYSGALCLVEWAEKFPDLVPAHAIHLSLEPLDSNLRRLQMQNTTNLI
jgi:tRNA threonylcarbamoyladenosine biosynthesis protein TsaE